MDINIFQMAREGEISVLVLVSIVGPIIVIPIQLLIAKLKGFRLMPAVISGCIPILNQFTMLGYILMAIFYKKPQKTPKA
ncbi:hypothetical protein [Pseudoalteromonas byunsanensis]|uniref:Uncharacterized protein n=1 Tax=Pseudoalteromonas byunsanensis TaxID=327939 RepID=A0A1S1N5H4_9GAMM|nr:hypothetical protein [Pseudoalteromonas byunsanensis]OHU96377.1 hypothetical protein BIW53_07500 [Pseudoalteromonas byunsanensis]